jgi:hypothetical protein
MPEAAASMITKAFFLAKKIHRIGTRNLRDKKGLLQKPDQASEVLRIAGNSPCGAWGKRAIVRTLAG